MSSIKGNGGSLPVPSSVDMATADKQLQEAYKSGNTQSINTALRQDLDSYAAQYGSDKLSQFADHLKWDEQQAGHPNDPTTSTFVNDLTKLVGGNDAPIARVKGDEVLSASSPS